jgi:putative membrane protein
VHVVLVGFATFAMTTFLAGEFPAWMQGPYTATVYEISWKYTGQVYVIAGLLAAWLHAVPRFGAGRASALFGTAIVVALASELGGTNVGIPFGAYHYTSMLGYRVLGDVPYVIPLSWCYMLYACLAMCSRVLPHETPRARWTWALAAGLMLTAWDVPLEVHMTNVSPAHWVWDYAAMPSWIPNVLTRPVFHGMPLTNWIGWVLTATLIARLMLAIVPPARWARLVAPATLPLVLYAVNGVMPIATIARHGYWLAAALGTAAMALPLVLALRSSPAPVAHPG